MILQNIHKLVGCTSIFAWNHKKSSAVKRVYHFSVNARHIASSWQVNHDTASTHHVGMNRPLKIVISFLGAELYLNGDLFDHLLHVLFSVLVMCKAWIHPCPAEPRFILL